LFSFLLAVFLDCHGQLFEVKIIRDFVGFHEILSRFLRGKKRNITIFIPEDIVGCEMIVVFLVDRNDGFIQSDVKFVTEKLDLIIVLFHFFMSSLDFFRYIITELGYNVKKKDA
jgi:hypothetical protein